jgi:sensor histidine kinase YesM
LGNLGTIYRDMGKEELSLKYYDKSLQQAKLQNDYSSVYWVYLDMSDMYLRKRDTSNAFKNYVQYKKYNDFYLKRSNTQGLADAKIRYDAETRNKELELLSLKLSKQKLLIYGYTGLFVLSLAIGILLYSRSRINAKRRISDMNHKIAEITQANLRQQMNPHFIFNTLNSIQYYMYQHDKLATNNYLTKFSSLMRKVLENSQHTSVPLRDELDALNLYLELEKIRFKDKFDYQINIDEEIDTILYKVPTMLMQPYVENSICHGLMPGEGNGLVKIDLELKEDYILCTIEDNGIGREAAQEKKMKSEKAHNSLGTQIVSSRLDLVNSLYGTSLKTIYTDLKNDKGEPVGTRVELHIPILT